MKEVADVKVWNCESQCLQYNHDQETGFMPPLRC